jgi:hypothetical protein
MFTKGGEIRLTRFDLSKLVETAINERFHPPVTVVGVWDDDEGGDDMMLIKIEPKEE